MQCPQCDQDNPQNAQFCVQCGSILLQPKPNPIKNARYCTQCGHSLLTLTLTSPGLDTRQKERRVRTGLLWILLVAGVAWAGVMLNWYYTNRDNSLNMKFAIIPSGCFQMGSSTTTEESPVHEVCLERFYLSKHEVTQAQWKAVMGTNPSSWSSCGEQCPVNSVSWNSVQDFINRLNELGSNKYRLPTEAEWEYACRGGEQQKYCGGNDLDLFAWHSGNSEPNIHPVGRKAPNGYGLYDMSGNVWEWVFDRYDAKFYANSPKNNPQGPVPPYQQHKRIFRGGSVKSSQDYMRPTLRNANDPRTSFGDLGFRLVRVP